GLAELHGSIRLLYDPPDSFLGVRMEPTTFCRRALFFLISQPLAAQNPTLQGHPEDYPRADVEHGARVYAEQCDRCHGANGTGVSGVDLHSGKFRNATTDQ